MDLCYPVSAPAIGDGAFIAHDLMWATIPLPYRIDHVNVWAIREGAGWALVDTGTWTAPAIEAWESLLSGPLQGLPITRVIATHMHPDHVGLAGWMAKRFGASLWMSQLEYYTCRTLLAEGGQALSHSERDFVIGAGWSHEAVEAHAQRHGHYGDYISDFPATFHRLFDGQDLRIGNYDWQVLIGHGHSPEHACLYNASEHWLISGDQVLPRISSNVSVHAVEPNADPMADWFASIQRLLDHVSDDVLVLPAHHACFRGLHARLRRLRDDQLESLEKLRAWLVEPRRVVDVFPALFRKPVSQSDASQLGLATGEALACLNYLMNRGEVRRQTDAGVAWYQRSQVTGNS